MCIWHVLDVWQTISPTRVVCRPVCGLSWTFPVVISLQPGWTLWVVQMRTVIGGGFLGEHTYLVRGNIQAGRGDVLDHSAAQGTSSVLYQASASVITHNPVVDIGRCHEFMPDLFPQIEVHGVPLRLTQGYCLRFRNVAISWPRGTWCDRVTSRYKIPK